MTPLGIRLHRTIIEWYIRSALKDEILRSMQDPKWCSVVTNHGALEVIADDTLPRGVMYCDYRAG